MESERRSLFPLTSLGAPALVAIAAALFAGALYLPNYQSARPKPKALPWDPTVTEARVPALATQDPLEVAYSRAKELGFPAKLDGIGKLSDLSAQLGLAESRSTDRTTQNLVLVVSLRSGAWPEDRERRVRTRYAVTTALAHENFFARSMRELRFASARELGGEAIVPYEWFDVADAPKTETPATLEPPVRHTKSVLCLWLDEALLDQQPFAKTALLLAGLIGPDNQDVAVRFIGPSSSGRLLDLLRDARQVEKLRDDECRAAGVAPRLPPWGPLEIVSPMATVPFDAVPGDDADLVAGFEGTTPGDHSRDVARLVRTIGQDDELAERLLLELAERIPALMPLRGGKVEWTSNGTKLLNAIKVDPAKELSPSSICGGALFAGLVDLLSAKPISFIPRRKLPVQVAVVSEQDSEYGRRWLGTLERERDRLARTHPLLSEIRFRFVPFSSVIDGNQLDTRTDADKSKDAGDARVEAVGTSQVDYLRRTEQVLAREGDVSAIIALATDVYDTLMILQALRPTFRSAVFLTTDMDVRVLESEHLPYTRNLIVASHFDVGAPGEKLRFRDSYQFSTHRAVELVVSGNEQRLPWRTSGFAPHLFEIGRGVPVELNTNGMQFLHQPGAGEKTPDSTFALVRMAHALAGFRELHAQTAQEDPDADAPPRFDSYRLLLISVVLALTILVLIARRPRSGHRPSREVARGDSHGSPMAGEGESDRAHGDQHRRAAERKRRQWQRRLGLFAPYVVVLGLLVLTLWGAVEIDQQSLVRPGEPLDPFVGVSVWPTVLLRFACALFCVGSIVYLRTKLIEAHDDLQSKFELWEGTALPLQRACKWFFGLLSEEDVAPVTAEQVWLASSHWIRRWRWLLPRLFGYVLLCHFIAAPFFMLSTVASPVRGEFGYVIERFSIFASVWSFFALVSYVLETSFLSHRLIARLADCRASTLPGAYVDREARVLGITRAQAEHRGRLLLARAITQAADAQLYFPAIAVGVMVLARASVLDNWSWPAVLVGTLVAFSVLLLLCVVNSHLVAREERGKVLEFLRQERLANASDSAARDRVDQLRLEIENLRGGAFSPLIEHPLVRSAALPLVAWLSAGLIDQGLLTSLMQKL